MRPPDRSILEPEQLRALADRHTGIGFDQALVLDSPRRADSALFYRIFNADGDEVEQCGNGARCIAALLHRRGRCTRTARSRWTARPAWSARASPATSWSRSTWACRTSSRARCPSRPPARPTATPSSRRPAPSRSARSRSAIRTRCCTVRGRSGPGGHARARASRAIRAFRKRVNVGLHADRRSRAHPPAGLRARRRRNTQLRHRRVRGRGGRPPPRPARPEVRVGVRGGELRVNWAGPGSRSG